jgi:predicted outer membrane repeat protein
MKTLLFIFIACFLSSFLHATIINVPTDQPTIQAGINAAFNGDTVLVQPGTYVENINFNGKLITVASLFLTTQNSSYISSTIINGNGSGSVVTFNHNENSAAVLCGFTITNGFYSYGGGIYCSYSSPSLQNVTISGNSATSNGGGIYCNTSSPSLENVTISGNSSANSGGGIFCYGFSPSLENVTISGNSSNYGGGIYCQSSSPSLENVTISGNSANITGGGIYCTSSSNPSIINSILWNDSPQEIYLYLSAVTATYSDIEGGWAGTGNIYSDPLFVDPGNGYFHLQSISPCIDAGDPASPLDPDGTIADMGAYYFPQLPPEANFTADITSGEVPLTVNFTDLSVQGSGVIDEWYWEFGDGNNSLMQNPANEYLLPGNYTVSLTVTDVYDSTDTEIKVDYITVNPPAYSGPVWHISTTGSDAWGNGSEQYPFATIQHGINISSDTETVLVQPGTYVESINYFGKLITVGSLFLTTQDPAYISSTIIDGNSSGSVITFNTDETSSAVLCGFTIINGHAFDGGGIYCDGSSPILQNVIISGNFADLGGGICCSDNANPSLQNVTILSNTSFYGGGIYCYWYSSPSLENIIISGNFAEYGGGMHCSSNSSPDLENVTISGNSANCDGAGICCWENSSPSLENVTISGNSATFGGGIFCYEYSNPSLENVTILGNSADAGGGIYCSTNSHPSLENVTISGNSALNYGGGIYCGGLSSPSLINSILWNDSPQEFYIDSGSVTATYSDIEGGWAGTGNIDEDPLFVDVGNADYHLQSTSPCIDSGDPAFPLDPDCTIVEMGAYYYYQGNIPPAAEFTSDITQGYSPLTINFTDLSIECSVVITEWYWDFGDGNNSSLQNPNNEYLLPGNYTVSLTVIDVNDSTDTKTKIDYITVFGNDPPSPPTNVQVNVVYPDAIITWTAVDTTIYGDPCSPDGYVVSYSEIPDDGYFWFLAFTANTNYTHEFVAQYSSLMFYNVIAVVNLSREDIQYLERLSNSHYKIRWTDVKENLKKGKSLK